MAALDTIKIFRTFNEMLEDLQSVLNDPDSDHNSISQALISYDRAIGWTDNEGISLFHWAAKTGNLGLVQILARLGCHYTGEDNKGYLPVHHAIEAGHLEVVKYFVEVLGVQLRGSYPNRIEDFIPWDRDDIREYVMMHVYKQAAAEPKSILSKFLELFYVPIIPKDTHLQ